MASATYTFPRTSLVLRFTIDLHRIIELARAAHPTLIIEVKCRLVKLVLGWGISSLTFIAIIPLHSRPLSVWNFTTWWNSTRKNVPDIVSILHVWKIVHWHYTLWYLEYTGNPRYRRPNFSVRLGDNQRTREPGNTTRTTDLPACVAHHPTLRECASPKRGAGNASSPANKNIKVRRCRRGVFEIRRDMDVRVPYNSKMETLFGNLVYYQ